MKKSGILKIISAVLVIVMTAAVFTGCSNSQKQETEDNGKLNVITSNFPPYDFLREIGGDKINLSMLISPGAESHSFEPTPQDIANVNSCDVFVYVGGTSDQWVGSLLDSGDNKDMKVVKMMDCVDLLEEPEEEGHDHEGEEAMDEHVWTDPGNAILIVEKLAETLGEADPENADFYNTNADAYIEKLENLDKEYEETIANSKRKTLVFGDRFPFSYLVHAYGLDYISAFPGCSTDTEASAADIAKIIDYVNENNIPVVFYIELSSGKTADTICEATGAKKLLLHSCHNVSKEDFEAGVTYLQLMENNLANIKEALN